MQDTDSSTEADRLATLLRERIPEMRKLALLCWGLMAAAALLALFSLRNMMVTGHVFWHFILLAVGIFGAGGIYMYLVRARTGMMMPAMAELVGLYYSSSEPGFADRLPEGLIPKGTGNKTEDHLSGQIGGRRFEMAEVQVYIRTRSANGKGSSRRTIFKGFAFQLQLTADFPDFRLGEVPAPGFFQTLLRIPSPEDPAILPGTGFRLSGGGAERRARLEELAHAILRLPEMAGSRATFHGAAMVDGTLSVACRHEGNLFDMPGTAVTDAAINNAFDKAFEDLRIPLNMVSALLEAEARSVAPAPAG